MPYSVLRSSQENDDTKVMAEFEERHEAQSLVDELQMDDHNKKFEFLIEEPPSKQAGAPKDPWEF